MRRKQLEFAKVCGWGGKRLGAGRRNLSKTVNHMKRPGMSARTPGHVTLRLHSGMPTMKDREFLETFRRAVVAAKAFGLKITQFSILGNHLHLIVEAIDNLCLSRGLQSLAITLAKAIRRRLRQWTSGKIRIFKGRYHLKLIETARQMKNTLRYVLFNEAHHGGRRPYLTVFSSNCVFNRWQELGVRISTTELQRYARHWREMFASDFLSPPESWLSRVGWTRA